MLRKENTLIRAHARCIARSETFMPKPPKAPPKFKTEAEEREYWESNDSSDYIDWSQARPARLPALKSSTKTISLRQR
jgi:hypothetical protein